MNELKELTHELKILLEILQKMTIASPEAYTQISQKTLEERIIELEYQLMALNMKVAILEYTPPTQEPYQPYQPITYPWYPTYPYYTNENGTTNYNDNDSITIAIK